MEQFAHGRLFDDAPGVHDSDALTAARHHAKIVGDEQNGQAELRHQATVSAAVSVLESLHRAPLSAHQRLSRSGSPASAIAISTRCRMPPLN